MHYLILELPAGHRLVDFANTAAELTPQIKTLQNDNADSLPVVISHKVLKSAYEVDAYGLPVQTVDGFLTPLLV